MNAGNPNPNPCQTSLPMCVCLDGLLDDHAMMRHMPDGQNAVLPSSAESARSVGVVLHAGDHARMGVHGFSEHAVVSDVDHLDIRVEGHGQKMCVKRIPGSRSAGFLECVEEQLLQTAVVRHLIASKARAVDRNHFMRHNTLLQITRVPDDTTLDRRYQTYLMMFSRGSTANSTNSVGLDSITSSFLSSGRLSSAGSAVTSISSFSGLSSPSFNSGAGCSF